MSSEPILHSPAIARVMVHFAASRGVSPETCLQGTGIAADALGDPENLVAREQEMRLLENLMDALPDVPALGFELGLQYNIAAFGVWGYVLPTCRNVREAIELAIRYLPLSTAYCQVSLSVVGEELQIDFDPAAIPGRLRQFLLERDIATSLNILRDPVLLAQPARRLDLMGAPPAYAGRIEQLCPVGVCWNQRHNRIVLSLQDSLEPLPTYNARFVRQLESQCRELLQQRQTQGIRGQVSNLLLGKAGFLMTTEEAADALHISARSLRRKLEAEGSSFRELVDETRQQVAEQLLRTTDMKVEELAFHLGYSDAATFTRAFRRWKQLSPGEFRSRAVTPVESGRPSDKGG